jgi:multidrug efflux pump
MRRAWIAPLIVIASLSALPYLMGMLQQEYIPVEDQDSVMALITAQEGTNIDAMRKIIESLEPPLLELEKAGSLNSGTVCGAVQEFDVAICGLRAHLNGALGRA